MVFDQSMKFDRIRRILFPRRDMVGSIERERERKREREKEIEREKRERKRERKR